MQAESEASSRDHASDEDVPQCLWLPEFELLNKGAGGRHHHQNVLSKSSGASAVTRTEGIGYRQAASRVALEAIYTPKGSTHLNFLGTQGRSGGSIAHLLHITDTVNLPERPATSYSSSRH